MKPRLVTWVVLPVAMAVCGLAPAIAQPDAEEILEQVEEKLTQVERYSVRRSTDDPPGYLSTSDFVLPARSMHSTIRVGADDDGSVELYWIGEEAYAWSEDLGRWLRVQVPSQPMSTLHSLFASLRSGEIESLEEAEFDNAPCWIFTVRPELDRRGAEAILGWLREGSPADQQLLATVEEGLAEAEASSRFWISQESLQIVQAVLRTSVLGSDSSMRYSISAVNSPGVSISLPEDALEAEGPPVSLGGLFLRLPTTH